jgi:hypothetical protein
MGIEKPPLKCGVCGAQYSAKVNDVPYCNKHYQSVIRYGHPNGNPRKSKNSFETDGNVLTIKTQNGDVILADADEYPRLSKYSWCLSKTGYAVANIGYKVTKMHRYILAEQMQPGLVVDHMNGNPLDNRKINLRICTQAENAKNLCVKKTNKLGVKGVRLTKYGRYNARIVVDRQEIHLGNCLTVEEAVSIRIAAEEKHYGKFAPSIRTALSKRLLTV